MEIIFIRWGLSFFVCESHFSYVILDSTTSRLGSGCLPFKKPDHSNPTCIMLLVFQSMMLLCESLEAFCLMFNFKGALMGTNKTTVMTTGSLTYQQTSFILHKREGGKKNPKVCYKALVGHFSIHGNDRSTAPSNIMSQRGTSIFSKASDYHPVGFSITSAAAFSDSSHLSCHRYNGSLNQTCHRPNACSKRNVHKCGNVLCVLKISRSFLQQIIFKNKKDLSSVSAKKHHAL